MDSERSESAAEREAEWLRRIAEGDRDAFEELYRAYQRRIFGYLFRMLEDAELAEETANDVLVEVWKSARSFQGRSRPSTWIFGIAHHRAMNELRKRRVPTEDLAAAEDIASREEGPEAAASGKERTEKLRQAISSLSPEHREVVELTFFRGLSYEEIARIAGCPVNTVKTRMFYARRKLQAILGGMGLGEEFA